MSRQTESVMPPQVAALPRTASGIPITYTVAWTSEAETVIRPDPLMVPLGASPTAPAIFSSGRRGLGQPKLAVSETSRQRACNVQGRCQVCGGRLRTGARWIADLRNQGQEIDIGDGQRRPLIVDSWTHRDCLEYALQACPGLARRRPPIFRVHDWQLVATFERPESIPPEQLPNGAIGWVKVVPLAYEEFPFDEALEAVRHA